MIGDAASSYYGARNVARGGGPRYADPGTTREGRIRTFEERAMENPGRAPGGSGSTGLSPTDARGWSGLVEDQTQYALDTGQADGVRLGHYGAPTNRGGSMPGMAMRGLQRAAGGGGYDDEDTGLGYVPGSPGVPNRPSDEARDPMSRIFSGRTVAGGVHEARRLGLMPQFDEGVERDVLAARGSAARRSMLTPMQLAAEKEDIGDRFEVPNAERGAMAAAGASDIAGRQKSHEFWRRGLPMMEAELGLDERLARTRGEAATLDDTIRANASRDVASTRAGATTGAAESSSRTSSRNMALQTLQRMIADSGSRGDAKTTARMQAAYEKMLSEVPQGAGGGGQGGGAAPGARKVVNGQTLEWDGTGWFVVQ